MYQVVLVKALTLAIERYAYCHWYFVLFLHAAICSTLGLDYLRRIELQYASNKVCDIKAGQNARLWNGRLDPVKAGAAAFQSWVMGGIPTDPDVVRFATMISIWGRWLMCLVVVFQLSYRPETWYPDDAEYLVFPVALVLCNGLVHLRIRGRRSVTWRWMLFLGAVDVTLVTYSVILGGGVPSYSFVAYYPAVAVIAVVLSSFWLSLTWTTATAVVYVTVCALSGDGVDLEAGMEKTLVARIAVMYILALGINFITRFERSRWRASVERERLMRRERMELSQRIHDTIAQTAYMIDLGIHRARELAGDSNRELVTALEGASALSRSAMWEMRGPIDAGHIVEGRELGRVLWSHCATFERITSVAVEMSQSGTEPSLAMETRTGLFSIAHNALTNAFLHARPSRVEVALSFEADRIRLSVSDDGAGLPVDYSERGRGIEGMRAEAERLGGELTIGSEGGGGTTVSCSVPYETDD